MRRITLPALLLLTLGTFGLADAGEPKPAAALETIGVMGASVSAGHGTSIGVAEVLDAGIKLEHGRIQDKSTSFFSSNPLKRTKKSIARLSKRGCRIVIGIDVFFWFVYKYPGQAQRKQELEQALAALGEWKVSLFVGDVALLNSDRLKNTPSKEELKEINDMIRAWGAKHDNVHVLPFADMLARLRAKEPVTVGGHTLTRDPKELFQKDQLHVTVKGQALLGLMVLDALRATFPKLPSEGFVQDLAKFEAELVVMDRGLKEEKRILRSFVDLRKTSGKRVELEALQRAANRLSASSFEAALKRLVAKGSLVVKDGAVVLGG
jgi:hypothetical protein